MNAVGGGPDKYRCYEMSIIKKETAIDKDFDSSVSLLLSSCTQCHAPISEHEVKISQALSHIAQRIWRKVMKS